MWSRGVRGSIGAFFFFQIYYRNDRDRFFFLIIGTDAHRLRLVFRPIAVRLFCGRFGWFEILKKKIVFLIIKNWACKPNINISTCSRFQAKTNSFFYLASHLCKKYVQNLCKKSVHIKFVQRKKKKKLSNKFVHIKINCLT